ncbi:hypothetical protein E3O67_03895 [Cryobacterium sp. TMT3-29-2]|nr:hypothetical protein E3O67_03895 [Cryobacterium sp. TMT3-29-2]
MSPAKDACGVTATGAASVAAGLTTARATVASPATSPTRKTSAASRGDLSVIRFSRRAVGLARGAESASG